MMMTAGTVHRDATSAEFFEATSRGVLLIRRCTACQHFGAPPVVYCRECGSGDVRWVPSSGRGVIASWSVVHRRRGADTRETSIIGIVELEEGPWLYTGLIGIDVQAVATGMPVTVCFIEQEGGETIPVFRVELDARARPDGGNETVNEID